MQAKKFYLSIIGMLFVAMMVLSACGDPTATSAPSTTAATQNQATTAAAQSNGSLPELAGVSPVTLPGTLQQAAAPYLNSVPNGTFTAYKSSDKTDKVKGSVADSFKKAGWDDQSAKLGAAAGPLEQQGLFVLLFQKGTKVAQVIGYPGKIAAPLGASVADGDTLLLVVSGGN